MQLSRIVIDTNVVIAAAIARKSNPARAIDLALLSAEILVSTELVLELEDVFRRPKFGRYSDLGTRLEYLASFSSAATLVTISRVVTACRDPKDNMVLAVALSGQANLIITGDGDLLSLHPFCGIPILTPSAYLAVNL